jgi:pimeloyl-ACP methyl ester carboxylesterase
MTWRRLTAVAVAVLAIGAAFLLWRRYAPRPITVTEGKFPEELVYVRSKDDIVDAGAMFTAPKTSAKPIAVIWIHGWGANFYSPTYANIGRALAARGYTTITANTRMHDLANVAGERLGKRIRGGGYWGIGSDQTSDLAAWIDFAESLGFRSIVLVGHSAGWAAVRAYQAERQDPRDRVDFCFRADLSE